MAIPQGFAKHRGKGGGGRGVGLRRKRDVLMSMAAPKPPLYIGEGEGLHPHLGSPPQGVRPALDPSRGAGPLSLPPINSGGVGGQPHPKFWRSPPPLQLHLLLSSAWRSPAGLPRSSITATPLCCCWMESSSTSPSLLAGSSHGRRHRAVCVLNAEVPCVRHLIIGDLNHDEYDSINPVHLNASA